MNESLIIFQENGLYGARTKDGEIIISPQYKEMYKFSCGLSMVRNKDNQYAYINSANKQVIPFGRYLWCDAWFTCGFARVKNEKFGIIDTLGNIIVPLKYDNIWGLNERYFSSLKAYVGEKEMPINLYAYNKFFILDGLKYIRIFSIKEFKQLSNCETLFIRATTNSKKLFFTYGCNKGLVGGYTDPQDPVVAIVINSSGKIFPLLIDKKDIGKSYLHITDDNPVPPPKTERRSTYTRNDTYTREPIEKKWAFDSFWVNADDDDYVDDYYMSLFLDALEGDISNYCNID